MPDPTHPHCIVYGSPFTEEGGYTIVGPFPTYRAARDYAGQLIERTDEDWADQIVIVDLHPRHPKDEESK